MPHSAPPSPAGSLTSDASSSSSVPPHTPSPALPTFLHYTGEPTVKSEPGDGGVTRTAKPSRRINSAERRATHNAVERARRETLNGRFLDLAGLLSNLQYVRRPSKSAIVNSSIAHLTASRRHRILAAQQLRMINDEADALRYEVNQWRMRAGIPSVDEPPRGDSFALVLNGELEFEPGDMLENSVEGEDEDVSTPPTEYPIRQYPAQQYAYYAPEPRILDPRDQHTFAYDLPAPTPVHAELGAYWANDNRANW
ncbi:hypothetical protein FB45DRAFT_1109294 [Roridomyces roridus]|uniref:BHLH domain-containing protein n=1 Tax=Roridomyces roridus TaxID=1738132 RepID=A0AAD7BAC6_9AGAR|nr:hypothetical protein FB45DRAFT_1109294 [Roridomyces roridus]